MIVDEEAMLVELAMRAADSGDAGHWPTVAAVLHDEVVRLRERLAEHERTQATGGPAPAMTRDWGNEQHVPPPESADRRDMDPPARYGASNAERSEQ